MTSSRAVCEAHSTPEFGRRSAIGARPRAFVVFTMIVPIMSACGYAIRGGAANSRPIEVSLAPVRAVTSDLDVPAEVDSAMRRAIANDSSITVTETATTTLEIEVLSLDQGIAPLSEPGLRAAQYVATVGLRARLMEGGRTRWTSPVSRGRSAYLAPPGRIEALDGAARRAMSRAIGEAADRIVTSLRMWFTGRT